MFAPFETKFRMIFIFLIALKGVSAQPPFYYVRQKISWSRLIFMEDHFTLMPDRRLVLIGRQFSKWSFLTVVFHENNSK